jgi:hypothetical protein
MAAVQILKKSFEVALMFWSGFVIRLLKLRIPDKGFAVLTPVFRL